MQGSPDQTWTVVWGWDLALDCTGKEGQEEAHVREDLWKSSLSLGG